MTDKADELNQYDQEHRPHDLDSITKKIFDTLEEIPSLAKAAVKAENDYDIAYAGAFLQAEGTVEAKKASVVNQLSEKWMAMENAKNSAKFAEQAAWNVLPKIMSVYQTLSKNEREIAERLSNGQLPRTG